MGKGPRPQQEFATGFEWGMKYAQRRVRGFMCKTDFDHELGAASGGNMIHPSVSDLKRSRKCWRECGIVEVEVSLVRVVRQEDFTRLKATKALNIR